MQRIAYSGKIAGFVQIVQLEMLGCGQYHLFMSIYIIHILVANQPR